MGRKRDITPEVPFRVAYTARGARVSRFRIAPGENPLRTHGSESLASPAPSFALAVAGRAFEVFPCPLRCPKAPPRCAWSSSAIPDGFLGACSARLMSPPDGPPVPSPRCVAFAAEAAASSSSTPCKHAASVADHPSTSPRLLLEVPLRRCSVRTVHSQPDDERLAFGPLVPPRDRVPPSWFLTTSTACSGPTARALLQPAADPGVHRVACCERLHRPSPEGAGLPARPPRFPRCTHPAKISPLAAPPHSPSPPKRRCSRQGATPMPFTRSAPRLRAPPAGCVVHRGVLPDPARLRGLAPRTGLLPPSAVSSDR